MKKIFVYKTCLFIGNFEVDYLKIGKSRNKS